MNTFNGPTTTADDSDPRGLSVADGDLLGMDQASFDYLLDRMNPQGSVGTIILRQIDAYFSPEEMKGKSVLDFGCGQGASTVIMAEKYPETRFIGVDLVDDHINIARAMAARKRLGNARFYASPDGESLPPEVEAQSFDAVMFSAVYEHLLPNERKLVVPLVWRRLKPQGVLFINQTPHSWFPYEHHSTGLPVINYVPDRVALWLAQRFGRMNRSISSSPDWNVHLRGGLRGGSEADVIRNISDVGGQAKILQPRYKARDRAEHWLNAASPKYRPLKRVIASTFRVSDRLWGIVPSINMEVTLQKLA